MDGVTATSAGHLSGPHHARTGDTEESDDALVLHYLDGDAMAFESLYRRYRGPLFRFFRRQVSEPVANDAFQDTWSKLISSLTAYEPRDAFAGYLFTIAHHVLTDINRREMRNPSGSAEALEVLESAQHTEAMVEREELQQRLMQEVHKLPHAQRSVWLLKQESGLSLTEIAEATSSTLEGVKSRLRYANRKLLAGMQRHVRR